MDQKIESQAKIINVSTCSYSNGSMSRYLAWKARTFPPKTKKRGGHIGNCRLAGSKYKKNGKLANSLIVTAHGAVTGLEGQQATERSAFA